MSHLLLIDDDYNLLQMVKLMLERVGHQVEISKDGEKGIVMAAQGQPDLAIIDVMMPGLSGYDVVRKLRSDPLTARIPIIILTARSQPMDKQMALEAGANAFLSKPVTAQELIDRVDAVLKAGVNFRVHTGLLTEPVPPAALESGPSVPSPLPSGPGEPAAARPAAPSGRSSRRPIGVDDLPSGPVPGTPSDSSLRRPIGADVLASPSVSDSQPRRPLGMDHALGAAAVVEAPRRPIGLEDTQPMSALPVVRLPVITVISLRGGVGTTTVAINVAFAMAGQSHRAGLVDLSPASGHVALYLHLTPPQHWGQLLVMGDAPDARAISQMLIPHSASGVSVLAAPVQPSREALSAAAVQSVLRQVVTTLTPVIVDARSLDTATTAALQLSAVVVVVMADDPASVHTTNQFLMMLNALGVDNGRVRLVLNHPRPMTELPADAIQKALRRSLAAELPFEPKQSAAIRRGVPLVAALPDSPFSTGIQQLARTLGT
jgi:CheY-like chemotaxis protein